jgi:Flp pilus assembly protein TadD
MFANARKAVRRNVNRPLTSRCEDWPNHPQVLRHPSLQDRAMTHPRTPRTLAFALLSSAAVLLAGCGSANKAQEPQFTGSISTLPPLTSAPPSAPGQPTDLTPIASAASTGEAAAPTAKRSEGEPMPRQSALVNATKDVAEEFKRNPGNAQNALQYVYNLRDLGLGDQATLALAEAYRANPDDPAIASEYGRLLVGNGKDTQAERVLDRAADENRDWRALSALGTIKARAGDYAGATEYFRRASELEPKRPSLINNLALALALDGKPAEAENLLRNADDSGSFGPRLRQNLALVLALQGKYDEAQSVATTDLPPKEAAANIAYIKKMTNPSGSDTGIEFSDESIAAAPARTKTAAKAPAPAQPPTPAAAPASSAPAVPAAAATAAPARSQLPDDGPATTSSIGKPAKPAAPRRAQSNPAPQASRSAPAARAPMELAPAAAVTSPAADKPARAIPAADAKPAAAARTADAAPAATVAQPAASSPAPAKSLPPLFQFGGGEPAMTQGFTSPLSLFSAK